MSHFYASIPQSARKTVATARGHKSTGVTVEAASWNGKIVTYMWHDEATGEDRFRVSMEPHHGAGDYVVLAAGVVGDEDRIRSAS